MSNIWNKSLKIKGTDQKSSKTVIVPNYTDALARANHSRGICKLHLRRKTSDGLSGNSKAGLDRYDGKYAANILTLSLESFKFLEILQKNATVYYLPLFRQDLEEDRKYL